MASQKDKRERFSILFDLHYRKLYHFAYNILKDPDASEEVVQESFIKLWEQFDPTEIKSFEAYLMTILKHKVLDHLRKEKVKKRHIDLYQLNQQTFEELSQEWEIQERIQMLLQQLPEKTRTIFKMSRINSYSYKEIAIIKDISVKTVESHISKALTILKQALKKNRD
ncbi:RNA polymerase sigma-70 factor [Muricauda sp. 2012CJ35-5]|uniref:RNA polymerase sigma-70 factor n=1 Tax=Flagellimonas spongiicola TaxID=2942208 RepID=A0ABT0PRS6_9FLAO|nr:RNA polymerase sigma-70 factor [Allomuricauda spongiicola]MCL6273163.1 RNA polymerase sigma-70 factor [Allomuricauda spongiicola]